MQHTMIEVNKLERSPLNARRTTTGAVLEDLKASILAHGLMQNLVVTDTGRGRYRVIAGGRRLEALRVLQSEGRLPDEHAVPCQIASDAQALEMSLAENTVRQAMHPADEYEAFARLIADGATADQVATRFGVTAKHVAQRLTLGRLAPELLAAYREEALTLDGLMAFAITDDRGKQLEVYRSLQPWQADNAREIRSLLTGEMAEASSKLARFVGLTAYHEAGGASRADLFSERVYLEHPALLHQLAADKLDAARKALEAEGWGWVEASPDLDWSLLYACRRIYPQPANVPQELLDRKAAFEAELEEIAAAADTGGEDEDALFERQEEAESRLAEIEDEIAGHVAFNPEQMRLAGCYVSIGHDGELSVEKGLVRREDAKRLDGEGDDAEPVKPKGLPETLIRDLEAYRLQAAQAEIAKHRLIALDLLAFRAARTLLARRPTSGGPDVQFLPHGPTPTVQKARTKAGDAFAAITENLPRGWLLMESEAEQFQAFLSLTDSEKLGFLAYGVAASLQPQLSTGREDSAYELALSLTDADLASYWRPTKANYLGRITRDQLLALGREMLGEQWVQARSRDKKGELADALERAFADPQRHARTPQQLDRLKHWLPEGMAFGATEPADALSTDDDGQRDAA